MTSTEFAIWRAQSTPAYAADKVRTGRWAEAESLLEAEKELNTLLPQGQETQGHEFFTIESEDGQVLGALWIGRAERATGPIGYIYDLVIWPEHRRMGHGAKAMRALEHEAVALGFGGLALHVFGHNRSAQVLYAKLGYMPTNINMFKPLASAHCCPRPKSIATASYI
jgi:ribosomal protein S18 acetylase RimI-like enzyme